MATLDSLNPFYVREDWLLCDLLGKFFVHGLNPFYVREDWLLTPLFFLLGIKVLRGLLPTFRLWQKLLDF